jgi:ABC-type phosphate transport system ATPase subunit
LSAIKIPKPNPIAVRVRTSNGATGSSSELFEMDMREDIAYQYTAHSKNETEISEIAVKALPHDYLNGELQRRVSQVGRRRSAKPPLSGLDSRTRLFILADYKHN